MSWRLMKTWSVNEVPARAPPMTEAVVRAMTGWAFFNDQLGFGISLLVGYYGLLRTGELLSLQAHQIHMISASKPAVLNLGLTKTGKRQGAAESVTLTEVEVLKLLYTWKQQAGQFEFLTSKPHVWRDTFNTCLSALKLDGWGFRPYSLRRGGATTLFLKTGSLDRVIIAGRWAALKTARIYLNAGMATLADIRIDAKLLSPFHLVFSNYLKQAPKLELALKKSRSGGRGKVIKQRKRKGKSKGWWWVFPPVLA